MSASRQATRSILLALAGLLTLLSAVKALHIDDTFTVRLAQQIARAPLDPFGFEIFWLQWPQPVHENLTAPVLPYWTAVAVRLFGEQPWLWKLWLFPFSLVLVVSLHGLLRRFAPGVELPLLLLAVVSPVVLPSLNLMQDLPALALGLGGLLLYLRAHDERSWWLVLAAGLLAGLALQTKYTQVTILGVMLLHGLLCRRPRRALVAVGLALSVFAAWESLAAWRYGEGMFTGQLGASLFWAPRDRMATALLRLTGATLPVVGLVGALALRLPTYVVLGLAGLVAAAFVAVALAPLGSALFLLVGIPTLLCFAVLALRGLLAGDDDRQSRHADILLAAWLVAEIAIYFAASPFPAARRLLGLSAVAVLLCGRHLVAPTGLRPHARRVLVVLVGAGIALGLLYGFVDIGAAAAQRTAVRSADEWIRGADPRPRVWFTGHWGFQYYAEDRQMQPVVPEGSTLRGGDWLVVPSTVHRQSIRLGVEELELQRTFSLPSPLPWTTVPGFYGGELPLQHARGPLLELDVYRVERDFVPETSWTTAELADWTVRTRGATAAAATPALIERLGSGGTSDRILAARALAGLGPRASRAADPLRECETADPSPEVRDACANAREAVEP